MEFAAEVIFFVSGVTPLFFWLKLPRLLTLSKTKIVPENEWLVQIIHFLLGPGLIFRGKLAVSSRECILIPWTHGPPDEATREWPDDFVFSLIFDNDPFQRWL